MIGPLAEAAAAMSKRKFYGVEELWRSGIKLDPGKLDTELRASIHAMTRAEIEMGFGITIPEQYAYEETISTRISDWLQQPEERVKDAVVHGETYIWLGDT
jgi:hypothetical protein